MAEENKIILDVSITGLESIDELNKQLADARKAYKNAQAGSSEYNQASLKINEVNAKLNEHKGYLKQVENQSKANSNTIEGLRAEYKRLSAEAIRTDIGSEKFKQLQTNAKIVSDQLKELEKGMGNTSRNVGNYSEGFKEALGNLGGGFGNAINGIRGFNSALAANPISAVVQVLNLLFNALGKNDNLMVAFQGTMKGIGVVIDNVSSFVASLVQKFTDFVGSGSKASNFVVDFGKRLLNAVLSPFQLIKDFIPVISNLMDGNFSQAFKAGGTAITNFGKNVMLTNTDTNALIKSITGLVGSGTELENGLDALEIKQSKLNVTLAENDKLVQQLRIQAKRRGEDTDDGLKLLERADKIEANSQKLRTGLIQEEIDMYEKYVKKLGAGSLEEENITLKLNVLRVKKIEAEKQSLAILEKNANAEAALREKQATARAKDEEQAIKAAEAQLKADEKAYDARTKLRMSEIDEEIKKAQTLEEIRTLQIEKAQTLRDAEVESIYNTNEEKAQAEQDFANSLLDINQEYTEKKKGTLNDLNIEKSHNSILLEGEIEREKSFTQLKSEFDQYERNKLIKEKLEIQIESFDIKKKDIQTKLQNFTITANAAYTTSVFIRKTTGALTSYPGIVATLSGGVGGRLVRVIVNTTTGTFNYEVSGSPAINSYSATLTSFNSDYWRLTLTTQDNASNTSYQLIYYPAISLDGTTVTNTATGSATFWGAQLEAGAYPTTYILTTATPLTKTSAVVPFHLIATFIASAAVVNNCVVTPPITLLIDSLAFVA